MARPIIALSLATAGLFLAGAAQAASVEVRDAAARVVVIPEARSDIRVEFLATHPGLPLEVRSRGDSVIVDGGLDRQVRNCRGSGARASVTVSGVGEVNYADLPQIVIRTPMAADVAVGGAVFGSVGRSQSLKLSNAGCGDWTIANVSGPMMLSLAGSGDMAAGTAAEADLRLAGSGDLTTRQVSGSSKIDIAGSGDISVAGVRGQNLQVRIAGSGDVQVGGGEVKMLTATIAGSGDIGFEGVAQDVKASIAGSGDVRVERVTGQVTKSAVGSGSVIVDNAA